MEQTLINLIERAGSYHIATVDGSRPQIRVFSSRAIIDGEFCICMGNNKNVYRQIKNNPHIAISGYISGYNWFRATGEATEITSDESKAQMFEKMPELKGLYSGREHEFSIFAVRNLKVEQF